VVPPLAAALAIAWPQARHAMLSIPMRVLVALNVVRVFAVLFLLLAAIPIWLILHAIIAVKLRRPA
jgi:hypothetical protein